ncbi:MAG: hypothetical protein ACOYOT_03675 [Bacteroidales bacterium]
MNQNDFNITFKTNFYSRKKVLSFSEKDLTLKQDGQIVNSLMKSNIKDIRCGISFIRGVDFTIGRIYCIDIKDENSQILKIRLRSLYGINKNILYEKYSLIIDKLYEFYFDDIISDYIQNILNGESVQFDGFTFNDDGICWKNSKEENVISWEDLRLKEYTYYFALFHKDNHLKYKALTYLTDWNSVVIYSIAKTILKTKGL